MSRWRATLIAPRLAPETIEAARALLDGAAPETLAGPTGAFLGAPGEAVALRGSGARQAVRDGLFALDADVALAEEDAPARRLLVLDMDGTLITRETIDELARVAGVAEAVQAITHAAMRGELDFADSLRRRVDALRGLSVARFPEVAARLTLTEGAAALVAGARRAGCVTALLSGGFHAFADPIARRLGIDHVVANRLEVRDGALTGGLDGPLIDAQAKADHLRRIAAGAGLDPSRALAVGDGANDLPMLAAAGLGVAFHAKPIVRAAADGAIDRMGLDALLYLLL